MGIRSGMGIPIPRIRFGQLGDHPVDERCPVSATKVRNVRPNGVSFRSPTTMTGSGESMHRSAIQSKVRFLMVVMWAPSGGIG